MKITWDIVQLDRRSSDGFVSTCHWTCCGLDGNFSASNYGSLNFEGSPTINFDVLTKENVLNWVWEKLDKNEIESKIADQIENQKTPELVSGMPW